MRRVAGTQIDERLARVFVDLVARGEIELIDTPLPTLDSST
jgi:hypothetical protein